MWWLYEKKKKSLGLVGLAIHWVIPFFLILTFHTYFINYNIFFLVNFKNLGDFKYPINSGVLILNQIEKRRGF